MKDQPKPVGTEAIEEEKKQTLELFNTFDVLGFSLDTLVLWNTYQISENVTEIFLDELHKKHGWPELISDFDYEDFNF
jgi:hypothetical protein